MKNVKGLLVIVLIAISCSVNAQFRYGVGGGVNVAKLSGKDISTSKQILGYNAGFMLEFKLPVKLGIEADILFSTKGASLNGIDTKFSYIDMPIVAKIYMAKIVSVQIGAQYSKLIKANTLGINIKDQLKGSDLSAVVGVGVDMLKLHASARYNYGLSSINNQGNSLKNNMITLTVGYWLK